MIQNIFLYANVGDIGDYCVVASPRKLTEAELKERPWIIPLTFYEGVEEIKKHLDDKFANVYVEIDDDDVEWRTLRKILEEDPDADFCDFLKELNL